MRARRRSIILGICVVIAILIAGAIVYLRSIDFGVYRAVVENRLERITGREVAINGDFDVALSLTPALVAEEVTLGNAPWGSRETMARAERVELEIQLLPLLFEQAVRVDRLVIARSEIFLETDAEGNGNWEFARERPSEAATEPFDPGEFLLEDVSIAGATVLWLAPGADEPEEIRIDRFAWQADDVTSRLSLDGSGEYRTLPVEFEGTVGSIANLLRETDPYPLELRVAIPQIEATIEGALGADPDGGDFALEIDATGEDIEPLGVFAGTPLPSFGPFEAHLELIDREERLAARAVRIAIGEAPTTRVEAAGRIAALRAVEGVDLQLQAEGTDLSRLAAVAGIELASFGPYTIEAHLTDTNGALSLTDVAAAAGDEAARIEATGTVREPLRGAGLDLSVMSEGQSFASLSPLVGADLPSLGPYRIEGHLTDPDEISYRLEPMEATLGDSNARGDLLLTLPAEAPPRIEGTLSSERLDLDQILASLSPAPEGSPSPGGAAESARIFSDEPFALDFLHGVEAALAWRASTVQLAAATLRDVSLELALEAGRLTLEPVALHVAGGEIRGGAAVHAAPEPARWAMRFDARGLNIDEITEYFAGYEELSGRASFEVDLQSTGGSQAAIMDQLRGRVGMVMYDGRMIGNTLHRMIPDLDILQLLPPFWGREEEIAINCFLGQSTIESGRAAMELLLDTPRMTLVGTGVIDLGAETLDLQLVPDPKSGRLSRVGVPVDIIGSLSAPEVRPQTDVAIGRGVVGLVGGLLLPLNIFAGLVGEGGAEACAGPLNETVEGGEAAE